MDFAQKIQDAQLKLERTKNDAMELVAIAEAEERELSGEEAAQLELMEGDMTTARDRITNLTRAEKMMGMRAVQEKAPVVIKRRGTNGKDREKGDLIFKMATNAFLASQHKLNPLDAAQKYYGHDGELQDVVKSAINPAATDVATWAAELVDDSLQGFLDILRGASVGWELLGNAGISVNFDQYGAIKVPIREGTTTDMRPGWTGERSAIPVRKATLGQITLSPYKWAAISTFSKELAMRSTPSIEQLIRQFIIDDAGTQLDNDLFGENAAVSGFSPAGLMNGVTGTPAASGGATVADDMNTDIKNLIKPLISSNALADPYIYLNPANALEMASVLTSTGVYLFRDDLSNGTLFTVPVRQSTNIPVDEHLIVDAASLASSVGAPMFEVNDTATLVEVDDDGVSPEMSAAYPRSPESGQVGDAARDTTNNPPIRSLFQTETVAVKNVQYLSWMLMHSEAVNRITGVSY